MYCIMHYALSYSKTAFVLFAVLPAERQSRQGIAGIESPIPDGLDIPKTADSRTCNSNITSDTQVSIWRQKMRQAGPGENDRR